jgi:predicted nucleic acid-binding protein
MAEAISNTSPLLYLYRIGAMDWLAELFQDVWAPGAVALELKEGRRKGHDVPTLSSYDWLKIVDPQFMPSEWLSLDLGKGELAALALALENPARVVLLDDALARRTAHAAGASLRRGRHGRQDRAFSSYALA